MFFFVFIFVEANELSRLTVIFALQIPLESICRINVSSFLPLNARVEGTTVMSKYPSIHRYALNVFELFQFLGRQIRIIFIRRLLSCNTCADEFVPFSFLILYYLNSEPRSRLFFASSINY